MSNDVTNTLRDALMRAVENAGGGEPPASEGKSGGGMSGMKGVAAGAGAAALVPLAVKNAGKIARTLGVEDLGSLLREPGQALQGVTGSVGDSVGSSLGDKVSEKVDEAGGPGGIIKDALPFGGGGGGGQKGGAAGVGKGRRMPIQQDIDVGLPIETVYNQFTQFEEWPNFMHRVKRVTQDDDCTMTFQVKIWGKTREFTAKIDTQRPDDRIKWEVSSGVTTRGTVSFHEVTPNLTRVLLSFDLEPGGIVEKFARGARLAKRAARADLHRFRSFIEYAEQETGAWRGTIEDGEVTEEHDPSYDEEREYSDIEDLVYDSDEDEDDEQDEDEDDQDESDEPEDSSADESDESDESEDSEEDESDEDEEEPTRRGRARSSSSGSSSRSGQSRRQSQSRNGDDEGRGRSRSGQDSQRSRSSQSRRGSSNGSGSSRRQTRSRSNHS